MVDAPAPFSPFGSPAHSVTAAAPQPQPKQHDDARIDALVELLAVELTYDPDTTDILAARHVADGHGYCRACADGGVPAPCVVARVAARAQQQRERGFRHGCR